MMQTISRLLAPSPFSIAYRRRLRTLARSTTGAGTSILSSKKDNHITTSQATVLPQSPLLTPPTPPTFLTTPSKIVGHCNFHTTAHVGKQHHDDIQITGVSDDVASIIKQYAHKQQTSASLQTLMKTGRGEFLHKTYGSEHQEEGGVGGSDSDSKVATDKILMQVRNTYINVLCIRYQTTHLYDNGVEKK